MEPVPRSPNVDPTFIKSMECSKFSSLVKNQDDYSFHHMVKTTSSDTPMSLGTPVSASEVTAALLGASTSSLCAFRRHRRIEEEDLSTPYNHYKCLSPKDRDREKEKAGKLLRRQFSLDKTEENANEGAENVSSGVSCRFRRLVSNLENVVFLAAVTRVLFSSSSSSPIPSCASKIQWERRPTWRRSRKPRVGVLPRRPPAWKGRPRTRCPFRSIRFYVDLRTRARNRT